MEDAQRLFEMIAGIWRVRPSSVRRGFGKRGACGRNVACAILGETIPEAWILCGYAKRTAMDHARLAMLRYLDCPIDGARIHRLLDLVAAEMPWLLEKLVVPEK